MAAVVVGLLAGAARADLYNSVGGAADARSLLSSSSPSQRSAGLEALEELPAREAAPLYLSRLADPDAGVRARAAQALGRRQILEAAGPLVDRLADPDSGVRAASAEALGRYGALLPGLSRRAAAALSRALGDAQFEVRLEALRALEHLLKAQALKGADLQLLLGPVLLRADDENVSVRRAAAAVLGRVSAAGAPADVTTRAVVALLGRLSDSARDVRAEALGSLGALRATAAAPAALRLLRDPAEEVRRQAVLCLGHLRAAQAVPALLELCEGPAPAEPLRQAAVTALGLIARPGKADRDADSARAEADATRALVRVLARDELRPAAREALAAAGPAAVPALLARLLPYDGAAGQPEVSALLGLLAEVGKAAPPEARARVLAAFARELPRGRVPREEVLDALGDLGDRGGAALCAGLLADPDVTVRRHAIAALRRPGLLDERAVDALLAASADADGAVRRHAIAALGELHAPQATPRLLQLLGAGDLDTQVAAAQALAQAAGPAPLSTAQALVRLLGDYRGPDARARWAGVDALVRLVAAQPALVDALVPSLTAPLRRGVPAGRGVAQAGESALHEVVLALGGVLRGRQNELGRETLLDLAEAEADGGPRGALAQTALSALGSLRDPRTASRLQRLLAHRDPLRRLRAAYALGCLLPQGLKDGDGPGQALLSALAGDADPRVRAEAAWALGHLSLTAGAGRLRERTVRGLRQALARAASARDPGERANLLAALYLLGQAEVSDAEFLIDGDPGVRANAALLTGLIAAGSEGLQARLRNLATIDEDHHVRRSAERALKSAGRAPAPTDRRHWIVLHHLDYDHRVLAEAPYRLLTPDGLLRSGTTDSRGLSAEEHLPPGRCEIEVLEEGLRPR